MSGVLSDDSDDEGTQYSDKGLVYLQGFMKKRAQGAILPRSRDVCVRSEINVPLSAPAATLEMEGR